MSNLAQAAVAVVGVVVTVGLLVALFRERRRYKEIRARYLPIVDIDEAVAKSKEELNRVRADLEHAGAEYLKQKAILGQEYAAAKQIYDRLKAETSLLEENLEDISFGLYKPHYDYDTSEKYRNQLESMRSAEKDLIRSGRAASIGVAWTINNSRREGERMQKQYVKLMLRAFNGECDAAVARVSWNNIVKMEERIRKTFEAVNALGGVMQISIAVPYLDLKLAELRLEFEGEEKKRAEVEEQRRIKEQMREEERAVREAERAREEAEAEEARSERALEKARAEMQKAHGGALEELRLRIEHLDAALHKAREMKEKATMMAQLTRAGYVYVISNIGSFGENVFKIGMTRRLEPRDRIKELGDASVPFDFDIHAMIYSEDAPTVECAFHNGFAQRRVNLINPRKEFFAVSIEEIQQLAETKSLRVELTRLAEARDYRQTLAMRAQAALRTDEVKSPFPDSLSSSVSSSLAD